MIPTDPPPSSGKPEPEDPLPHASPRRDIEDDLWDLDGDEEAGIEVPNKHPDGDPLARAEGEDATTGLPTSSQPRPIAESQHVRKDLNSVDKPKEVRPQKALQENRGDFSPLDELTGLGDLEEPDLAQKPATPEPAMPEEVPEEPLPTAGGVEESLKSEDSVPDADAPKAAEGPAEKKETPFESREEEVDNRETLFKELQKGWGAGLKFLLVRIRAFSLLEQISCVLILLGIIGFSTAVFFPALYGFPDQQEYVEAQDFPVRGNHLQVRKGETYWREPIVTGAEADTVRLGVALLPVIDMEFGNESGMIRLLFRNGDGRLVGDPLTMPVKSGQSVSLSATTGLRDTGMFSAYRTGETEPWTVELFEASSENAAPDEYALVFKMAIAPILK